MSKNRKLTDFFKPFASPRAKRRLSIDHHQSSTTAVRSDQIGAGALREATQTDDIAPEDTAAPVGSIATEGYYSPLSLGLSALENSEQGSQARPGPGEGALPNDAYGAPSQSPSFNSNRQVVRNGQLVIKSSDDEDSTSDSSLDDLDDLLTAQKPMIEMSAAGDVILSLDRGTVHTRSQTKARQSEGRGHSSSTSRLPVIPRYKFSLDSLVSQSERDTASESDVAKARSLFRAVEEQGTLARKNSTEASIANGPEQVHETLLASVVSGSGEGTSLHKVLNTMKRTEALHRAKSWLFFCDGHPLSECKPQPFPTNYLSSPFWRILTEGQT